MLFYLCVNRQQLLPISTCVTSCNNYFYNIFDEVQLFVILEQENVKITSMSSWKNSYAYIKFTPSTELNQVLSGQLVILYDVKRDNSGGEIEVMNGYFVHFFAPTSLPKGQKSVVFVLDKSGSMQGRKFKQTQVKQPYYFSIVICVLCSIILRMQ